MTSKENRPVKVPSGGFISELALRIKLIMRLMGDKRVSPLLKLVPVGTLVYLVFPDPILLPFDDAAVIGLGMSLFVELCPEHVVDEHMRALRAYNPPQGGSKTNVPPHREEDIMEGEFRDVEAHTPAGDNGQEKEQDEK